MKLIEISRSRTEALQRVERAKILLAYAKNNSVSSIARRLNTNRPKIERCIDKALHLGPIMALEDLPGRGRPALITSEARAWVISLACQKPKDLGYSYELWTTRLLARHIRINCIEAGHPCLENLYRGTVSKILSKGDIRPHKIKYYLKRRDQEFDKKMAHVLHIYKEVEMLREVEGDKSSLIPVLSYNEKPGTQAIGNKSPGLSPVPGKQSYISRDHEYVRYGTVSLLAGIDLLNAKVYGIVQERHCSKEFITFLEMLDQTYPPESKIRIILDNHKAHMSKETMAYLSTVPNRFEFIFTPKHGSWLNLIESFFAKMAKTMLRGIRVSSKEELKERIIKYLDELNEEPVVFRWKYGLESLALI